jgi:hypothetical protein
LPLNEFDLSDYVMRGSGTRERTYSFASFGVLVAAACSISR